ncbi:MAG: hypothetical protein ASARMPRED_003720 [Alectoria sarmentosa]|nr:MAG: hypothetical protein ASARMPRED_003720 [Alectoria sarmentosa]
MDMSITPAIKVMTLFLLITSILVVIARGITKAVIVRSINLDDYLIALSLTSSLPAAQIQLFNIGQSVAVFFQAENGYGMPSKTLSLSSLSSELKSEYAAALLYILSLLFAKLAVLALVKTITPNRTSDPTDPTLDTWPATICTQIIQCLSISSACFLYLKPFLDSVESGFIRSDDLRRRGSDYKSGSASTGRNVFSVDSVGRSKGDGTRMKSFSKPHYAADIEGGHAANRDDSESQHSRTHIIKETRTFAVETFPNLQDTSPYRSDDAL